jgi:hypothetical protein
LIKCSDNLTFSYVSKLGFLTTLSAPRLYSVDDDMINGCESVDGMTIGRGNGSIWGKPAPAPLRPT